MFSGNPSKEQDKEPPEAPIELKSISLLSSSVDDIYTLATRSEITLTLYLLTTALAKKGLSLTSITEIIDTWHELIFGMEPTDKEHLKILEDVRTSSWFCNEPHNNWNDVIAVGMDKWEPFIQEGLSKNASYHEISRWKFAAEHGASRELSWDALLALGQQQNDPNFNAIFKSIAPKQSDDEVVTYNYLVDPTLLGGKPLEESWIKLLNLVESIHQSVGGKVFVIEDVSDTKQQGFNMRSVKIRMDKKAELDARLIQLFKGKS